MKSDGEKRLKNEILIKKNNSAFKEDNRMNRWIFQDFFSINGAFTGLSLKKIPTEAFATAGIAYIFLVKMI